jgi:type I restriction enzyme, S subunit
MNMAMETPSRTIEDFLWKNISQDWLIQPLKYLCTHSAIYGVNISSEAYVQDGIRFLRTTDIREDGVLNEGGVYLPKELAQGYILQDGDLLISRSGTVGRAFLYSSQYGLCSYAGYLVRFVLQSTQSPRYYFYITKSSQFQLWLGTASIESTINNVNGEKYANFLLPNPPLSQQRRIADYLDRETAKLDALIGAKKRLLELLAEKRRSLITQAVTRGLKPDVPMQDSGIESLGNIPAHWNIEHLKYHLFNIEQGWSPQSDNFPAALDEWGVLKVGAVNGWDFNSNENKRIPPELEIPLEYEIRSGDILVSRANTPELVGSASLVKEVRSKLILCDKLYRLIPQGNRLLPEYLVFYLRSSSSRFEFERDASGSSSSMQNISQGTLANLWIPIPPVDEQIQMVTYIKNKLSLIEKLETTARQVIALLQERRTSLISTAVTGQLQIPN